MYMSFATVFIKKNHRFLHMNAYNVLYYYMRYRYM